MSSKNQILFRFQFNFNSSHPIFCCFIDLYFHSTLRSPLNMKNQKIRLKLEYRVFVLVSIFDITQRRGQSTANGEKIIKYSESPHACFATIEISYVSVSNRICVSLRQRKCSNKKQKSFSSLVSTFFVSNFYTE